MSPAKPARTSPADVEAIPFPPADAPSRPGASAPRAPAPAPAPVAAPAAPAAKSSSVQTGRGYIDDGVPEHAAADGKHVELAPGEPQINRLLRLMKMVDASDLHLSANVVAMVRKDGEIHPLERRQAYSSEEIAKMIAEIIPERSRIEFDETNDADFAHNIPGLCRFRANVFRDRHGVGAVFRQIPFELLSVEKIGVPPKVLDLCWLTKGLVVVTGPTGSGKSTTLSTLIDFINMNRADHIITIEDPIEFVHPNKKCLVNQREIGEHTTGFKRALRAALREDPDIVLVGEMRDLETIAIAIETAETGHLVFGTLHTTSAASTVDRIIDQFPADQQEQIRIMLSESFRGCIAQVLCKKKGGGRIAAYEVLIGTSAVANLIREGKTVQLKSVMQTGRNLGMQTMNDHLLQHVKNDLVTPEEAYMKSNDKQLMKSLLTAEGFTIDLPQG
ncbi:MAG: type IV pilus twitching motility protein PilT [Myxococcales bacterium]|nr:type IV pilus twitching motility protein PilT [Myxococcales bacterium]